jgi:spore germination protein KB
MAVLFFIFTTGSSIINIPGPLIGFAKNGAWISLIISMFMGILLLAVILFLFRRFSDYSLVEYGNMLVGRVITAVFTLLMISFMFHMATGIVLDIGLFMTSSMMRQTPIFIFNAFIFFVVAVTVRSGLEAIARMFAILVSAVIFFVVMVLILSIQNDELRFLKPVLPDGMKPVLLGSYFTFGFPYVEIVLFAFLLHLTRKEQRQKLSGRLYLALCVNGFSLIVTTLVTIMTFGPIAGERKYSLFEVARTIDIMEIFQRIEVAIGISLIVASFMKATITLYVLNLAATHMLRLEDSKVLIFPIVSICLLLSLLGIANGGAKWGEIVGMIHPLWGTCVLAVPLLILAVVALIRGRSMQEGRS